MQAYKMYIVYLKCGCHNALLFSFFSRGTGLGPVSIQRWL